MHSTISSRSRQTVTAKCKEPEDVGICTVHQQRLLEEWVALTVDNLMWGAGRMFSKVSQIYTKVFPLPLALCIWVLCNIWDQWKWLSCRLCSWDTVSSVLNVFSGIGRGPGRKNGTQNNITFFPLLQITQVKSGGLWHFDSSLPQSF